MALKVVGLAKVQGRAKVDGLTWPVMHRVLDLAGRPFWNFRTVHFYRSAYSRPFTFIYDRPLWTRPGAGWGAKSRGAYFEWFLKFPTHSRRAIHVVYIRHLHQAASNHKTFLSFPSGLLSLPPSHIKSWHQLSCHPNWDILFLFSDSFVGRVPSLFESRRDFWPQWLCESKDTPTQAHHRTHYRIGIRLLRQELTDGTIHEICWRIYIEQWLFRYIFEQKHRRFLKNSV